jgi:WD40 repeat protein
MFSARFSPDGDRVITASEGGATISSASNGRPLISQHYGVPVAGVAFSPDGSQALSTLSNGTAVIWSAVSGRRLMTLDGASATAQPGVINALAGRAAAFSPDGHSVVTAAGDDAIIWSVNSGRQLLVLRGHDAPVTSAAFSPDGRELVTASVDGSAIVWSASTGKLLITLRGNAATVYSAAFSPDGDDVVTASANGAAVVWDWRTGQPLSMFGDAVLGLAESVDSAAFSPSGAELVTGSADGTASIWSTELAGPIASLQRLAAKRLPHEFTPEQRRYDLFGIGD